MKRVLLSIALLSAAFISTPADAGSLGPPIAAPRPEQSLQRLTFRGTTSIGKARLMAHVFAPSVPRYEARRDKRGHSPADVRPEMLVRNFAAISAAVGTPSVTGRGVTGPDPGFFGFSGLTHADQRNAGTGIYTNTQFSLEPPDQGLCVGNGFVLETVNNALAVYTEGGGLVAGPVPMNAFYGLAPEIVRPDGPYGPFLSDPECYFDRDTQRWYVSELEFGVNPATGADNGQAFQLIAVSQTPDPTGSYNVLSFDTAHNGNPGCPCFGDQPLLGADANGIYISTNEFPLFNPGFNGAQIYALSKISLALGMLPTVVHFDVGASGTPDPGGIWYSVHPAFTPELRRGQQQQNGTEYFLSSLDFFGNNDRRIAAWSLTNTASLWNPSPHLKLQHTVIASEAYGIPPPATQKPGPRPLGDSLKEPLELIDSGDDRMHEVVFSQGLLWGSVGTAVRVGAGTQAGAAFFAVAPSIGAAGKLAAKVVQQGYVAVAGQNVIYPSIGVNSRGTAVMVDTLTGPNYFPSAVYVPLNAPNHRLRIAGAGALPDDGFTGYAAYGGSGVARWGDYSAAVTDERGNFWLATEYIPNAPRTVLANWGTFIGELPGQ